VAVIAYSLGTLAWTFSAPHLVLSAILNLTLVKGLIQDREETYIEHADVTPVLRSYMEQDNKVITKIDTLENYAGDFFDEDDLAKIRHYYDIILGS